MSWLGFPCKIEKQTKQLHALKNKQNSCAGSVRRQETGRASRRPSVKRGEDREGRARLRMKAALAAENQGWGPMRASQGARGGAGPPLGHFCSRIRLWSPECFENLKTVSFPLVRRQ